VGQEHKAHSLDIVLGSAVLHHLILPDACVSIERLLSQGGPALFVEPLAYNPLIQVFRQLTPWLRTPDKTPFAIQAVEDLGQYFVEVEHDEYYLMAAAYFLIARLTTEQVKNVHIMRTLFRFLNSIDSLLLARFPRLKKYCWVTLVSLWKETQDPRLIEL